MNCSTEALQREPKEALQCRPGHGLLPQRVCCPQLCAMPVQHSRAPEQALEDTSPEKIDVTSKSPVGDISVVTLIRTDTTLDHSQKAEKVWGPLWERATHNKKRGRIPRLTSWWVGSKTIHRLCAQSVGCFTATVAGTRKRQSWRNTPIA